MSLVSVFLLFTLFACSVRGPLREDQRANSFSEGPVPTQWKKIEIEAKNNPQIYYVSETSGSTVSLSSVCERYQESKLRDLSRNLTNVLSQATIVSQEEREISGRASLWTQVRGKLDGVHMESLFVVMRKNSCIFDFTLHSLSKISKKDLEGFTKWVEGFDYRGK